MKNRHESGMEIRAGLRNISEITVFEHVLLCHPQMEVKKEAVCEHDPEPWLSPLDQSSSKMDRGKVKNCSVTRQIEI